MSKKTIVFSIVLCWALLLGDIRQAFSQTDLFDGRLNVMFKLEEYIVWRESHHKKQRVQYKQFFTMWRHRGQAEILWKLYDKEDTFVNLFTWLDYYYEMGPDINSGIRKAMSAGQRYKDYQAPFRDSDDILHECYLDINRGPLTVRLGKQTVIWGEMQLQRTTDVVNPLDLRYSSPGIDDIDELKMGLWMIRTLYQSSLPGDLNFEFILNPGDYKQIRLGVQGSDRGPPSVPNEELGGLGITGAIQDLKDKSEPRFSLSNYEMGIRVSGLFSTKIADQHYEILWKLMYFNSLDDSMIVDKVDDYGKWAGFYAVARTQGVKLGLPTKNIYDAKRFQMYGLSLETFDPLLTKAVIIGEFAYFSGLDFNKTERPGDSTLGKTERDLFTYGLTFSRAVRTLFLKKLDHKAQGFVNVDFAIFQGWFIGNVSRIKRQFSYNERSNTTFTLMLRTHFKNQTFTPVLRTLYDTRNWGYLSISCTVSLTTRFKFTLGFSENYGNDRTDDGVAAAYNKDRFYLKLKYQF